MANQPGRVPDNAITRLADQVSEINRNGGSRFNTADVPPAVSTPAMRRVELPKEEVERLDRLAADHGVEGYDKDLYANRTHNLNDIPASPRVPLTKPFLPDFTKVQSIDLVKHAVIVDGVEFEYAETDQEKLVTYCMEVVMDTLGKLIGRAKVAHNLFSEPEKETVKSE